MSSGATYTEINQNLVINGVPMTFSRAEGTFCTMSWRRPERTAMFVGVDGAGMYVRSRDQSAVITLVVLANGVENDILDGLLKAQEAAPNGLLYPIMVQQGLTLYAGLGVIAGPPPVGMSDAAMTNTWTFNAINMAGKTGSLPASPLP